MGVDDKAGIAAAVTTIKYFIDNPSKKHGEVSFAFGPDEEIGLGAKRFNVSKFPVSFAYTLDNGLPGQIEPETFNAAQSKVTIKGTAVHPGNAYKTMVNAITIANEIISKLPKNEVPENSKGRDGFFLVTSFQGSISEVNINIIVRDFDNENFIRKKRTFETNYKRDI
nr:M20/M25/M40 family metallo-hydrolase [Apilactobacillus ozensis]